MVVLSANETLFLVIARGHAKIACSFMKGVMIMKHYKHITMNKKDHRIMDIAAIFFRVLLTPIFIWYRLYLWVWDGTMFD